jgi:photosystem II stability/assembly factor-like uncharacterized protein
MRKILYLGSFLFVFNILNAQWKDVPGLYLRSEHIGMDIKEIICNGELLYAIINNYVYLSYNKGDSWMYASGDDYIRPNCIASIDSSLYIGTNVTGVLVSNDFGSTYEEINQDLPENSWIKAIHVTDSVLVAAVDADDPVDIRNVYISFDKGNSWLPSNGLNNEIVKCITSDNTILYAGTTSGIFQSIDNGRNWNNIGFLGVTIDVIAAKDNKIYAAESSSGGNLFLSTDNGINWDPVEGNGMTTWFFSMIIKDQYIFIAAGVDGIIRSNNYGATWENITDALITSTVTSVALCQGRLLIGTYNGLTISDNYGSSLEPRVNSFNLNIRDIAISGDNILATTNQGLNQTMDHGESWERKLINMNIIESCDSFVCIASNSGFYYSYDYGKTSFWDDVRGLPDDPMITDFALRDSIAFGSLYDYGIYFSDNWGVNWIEKNNGLTQNKLIGVALIDSLVFAATESNGIFLSSDYGENWLSESIGLENQHITCIETFDKYLYIGTSDSGFFRSSDYGENWYQISIEPSNSKINCLHPLGYNIFAAVKGKGLYMSANNGDNWEAYNDGLLDYNVNSIDCSGNSIYIGSKGGAIWYRSLTEFPLSLSIIRIKSNDNIICEGEIVQLDAIVIGGHPPYTLNWNNDSTGYSINVAPVNTTKYILTLSDTNLDTVSFDNTIWVIPRPDKPTLVLVGDTLFSNIETGNIWYYENERIKYIYLNKYIPTSSGTYSVRILENGCLSDESNSIFYNPINIINSGVAKNINIYPNPANNKSFIINIKLGTIINIYSISGKKIKESIVDSNIHEINIEDLKDGLYIIHLKNESENYIDKFIKQ